MTEGWVIMNANMDQYRAWQDGGTVWVKDLADATFYARRVDAEAVHLDDDAAWRVVLRPLPDGGEAVHTGQIRDEPVSSPPPSGEVRGAIRNIIRDRVSGPQFSDVGMKIAHERDIALAADAILALIPTRDEAARPEAPEGWVLVPRDPSRKLVEDLAHEWAYDVEEACESYQGFLGVCAKHGLAGSDPGAYEAAPPPPPVAETSADVVRLVKAARKAYRSVDPKDISDLPLVNELGAAVSAFDDCVPWERPASRAPTDTGDGR